MHHYQHHIGDYASHTGHLTPLEDIAYRRILDLYYLHERPFNGSPTDVARAIRMREHPLEVEAVLREFFVWTDGVGWVQERAQREVAEYGERREDAAKAGRASGRARRKKSNERSTDVQRSANDRSTNVEPTGNREPVPEPVPPNPPDRADARGAGAARAEPEPEPKPKRPRDDGASPIADLTTALLGTRYRAGIGNAIHRRAEVRNQAAKLVETGLTTAHVAELSALAIEKSEDDPGALLAHWLDGNGWREVLDERLEKSKHAATKARGRTADDALEGIYGDTATPARSVVADVLAQAKAGGS